MQEETERSEDYEDREDEKRLILDLKRLGLLCSTYDPLMSFTPHKMTLNGLI